MARSAAGSIRRLDSGPANKEGRYELRYRGKSKTFRGTLRQAERQLNLFIAQHSGAPPADSISLTATITARLDSIRDESSPVTMGAYQRSQAKLVDPYPIATMRIDKITAGTLEQHYRQLLREGAATAHGVAALHRLIRASLQQAWRWSWVEGNVASKVSLRAPATRETPLPSLPQVQSALAALDERFPLTGSILRVAAGTGLRRGELCGLRWADVDLDARTLTIQRSVVTCTGSRPIVKGTKTDKARVVPLGDDTAAVLAARWAEACNWAEECNVLLDPEVAYIWTEDPTGQTHYNPDRVTRNWRAVAEELGGLDQVTPHDLRALYVSLLRAAGVPLATVSATVGHASLRTTEEIYERSLSQANPSGSIIDQLLKAPAELQEVN